MISSIAERLGKAEKDTVRQAERELKRANKRLSELDRLFAKLYEEHINGKVSERNYNSLSAAYETEQTELESRIAELNSVIKAECENGELFRLYREVVEIVEKYLAETAPSAPEEESADAAELNEISAEKLSEYLRKAAEACKMFDGDTMNAVAEQTKPFSFNGEPLYNYFGKAAQLAEDFEYEAVAAEIEKLEAVREGR